MIKTSNCFWCGKDKFTAVAKRADGVEVIKCSSCGLMMVAEIRDEAESLYSKQYFEKQEGSRVGYVDYLSSPVANLLGKYAFSRMFCRNPKNQLDLGAADGSLIEIFESEGVCSRGLEISGDAVRVAQGKGLNVSQSNLSKFPHLKEKFDLVTAFDLLEHLELPRRTLKEVSKNLSDGGYFVFSTLSVRREDGSEFWFMNSLEHFVYFNKENLDYILCDIFGKDNYSFIEIENNGIAEFFGIAKKGTKLKGELAILSMIKEGQFGSDDAEGSFFLSLIYNQISKFEESKKIIDCYEGKWTSEKYITALFYNLYFQGRYEKALALVESSDFAVSARNAVFWQALAYVEKGLYELKRSETDREIFNLRAELFKAREEVSYLHQSRIIGKAIWLRDFLRAAPRRIKALLRKVLFILRRILGRFLPRKIRQTLREYLSLEQFTKTVITKNELFPTSAPLITIVTPYYNHSATIRETVESVLGQTFQNFEYIIVNDGSTAEHTEALRKINNPKIRIINLQENLGNGSPAAARNTGLGEATGKYAMCLDSDDILDPNFLEKALVVLETNPEISLVTTYMKMFGAKEEMYANSPYNAYYLFSNNMVITGAPYPREAWKAVGGYKCGIGYEDWEFWMNLAEHGYWGKLIPEPLYRYRTALASRYVEDMNKHRGNIANIRSLHPQYKRNIKRMLRGRRFKKTVSDLSTAFVNLDNGSQYFSNDNENKNILIAIPWMTFGGAETLIYNYCKEIKDNFNISFVTGLPSEHEWEYKFREITTDIYHLPNLFDDKRLYLEFMSNYIKTRNIEILHIIHNGFVFEMLPELKKRHPDLKVIVTMFNDRVEYFEESVKFKDYIDVFSSDNNKVGEHYFSLVGSDQAIRIIPNGIDCYNTFCQDLFDREEERKLLSLSEKDIAIFFVGRLSAEKKPDVFVEAAAEVVVKNKKGNIKFFIIGDGPMRASVENQISKIGSEKIQYLGYQSNIAKYLSAADIFVLSSSIEGFPLAILEAMAMKVAVIASNVGGVSDIIISGKGGFVVNPASVDEIVEKILILESDRRLLGKMKLEAREVVEEKYSSLILGEKYTNLYMENLK